MPGSVNSGISAKSTILQYDFGGRIWAGRAGSSWPISTPSEPKIVTDLTESLSNISVGINSLARAFSIRALVGIGAFGFNAGVYAAIRFGGSILGSPTEARVRIGEEDVVRRPMRVVSHHRGGVRDRTPPEVAPLG